MAFIEKNNSTQWTGAAYWFGGVAPTTQDVAYIGPNTTINQTSQGTGTLSASCVSFEDNGAPPGGAFSAFSSGVTASGFITRIGRRNPTQGGNSQYSMYVGINKTLQLAGLVDFVSTYTTNHYIYTASGGYFYTARNGNSGQGQGGGWVGNSTATGVRIYKQGPGTIEIGNNIYSTPASTTYFRGGYTIQDGTLLVPGYQPPREALGESGFDNTLQFNAYAGGNPVFRMAYLGLTNESTFRTVTVPVLMTTNGTILVGNSLASVTLTMSGEATGAGTLTIAREGPSSNLVWNNNISCPVHITGLLTLGGYGLYGTVSGAGTITFSSTGTFYGNAPSFTGTVNGPFVFTQYNKFFAGIITGTCTLGATYQVTCTYTGTHPGAIADVQANSTFTFRGLFNTSSGTTQVFSGARLVFDGVSANINPGRGLSIFGGAYAVLTGGASVTTGLGYAWDTDTDSYLVSDDANTNTVSGIIYTDIWTSGTSTISTVQIRSKANGTLVIAGNIQAFGSGEKYRLLNINGGAGDTSSYTGRVKLTGNVTSPSPLVLTKGELEIGSNSVSVAGGVVVNGGKLILPLVPAGGFRRVNQPVTLAADSTVSFVN